MAKRTPLVCQQLENISRDALEKYHRITRPLPWLEQRPAKGEPVTAGHSGNTNAPPATGFL